MVKMRDTLIKALLAHAKGDIQKHVANVEVYLNNPTGIGEHSDICLLYTSPSPRDATLSRMPSSA